CGNRPGGTGCVDVGAAGAVCFPAAVGVGDAWEVPAALTGEAVRPAVCVADGDASARDAEVTGDDVPGRAV
ncbi:MAG TPA: hypothetical protein VHL09_01435, partial [Dehalococcoidia bacterium]|nr:hypothetical protein [Dehalococcoidia bacterium]